VNTNTRTLGIAVSNVSNAIKKHIGVQVSEEQLNHYTLLGLNEDASLEMIKQALRCAVAAWNSSDTKLDPTAAQQVAKLIKQAQADLLAPSKKKEYDQELNRKLISSTRSILPTGDAFARFDATQFLVSAVSNTSVASFGSSEKRWGELCQKIPSLAQASLALASAGNAVSGKAITGNAAAEKPVQSATLNPQPTLRSSSPESATSKIDRLKRQRKTKQSLYVAGFFAVAFAFLGYAGFQFILNRQQLAKKSEVDAKEPMSNKPNEASRPIGRDKATNPMANDSGFVLPTLSRDETSVNPSVEPTDENPFGKPPVSMPMAETMKPTIPATDPAIEPMNRRLQNLACHLQEVTRNQNGLQPCLRQGKLSKMPISQLSIRRLG